MFVLKICRKFLVIVFLLFITFLKISKYIVEIKIKMVHFDDGGGVSSDKFISLQLIWNIWELVHSKEHKLYS